MPTPPTDPIVLGGFGAEGLQQLFVDPKVRALRARELGRTRQALNAQGLTGRIRNLDLGRRLGLAGTGAERGLQRSLSTSLGDAFANSLARRRVSLEEEVQKFRQTETERIIGDAESVRRDQLARQTQAAQTIGTLGGAALSVIPIVGGGLGAGLKGGIDAVANPAAKQGADELAATRKSLLDFNRPALELPTPAFGGTERAGASTTEQLGSRLAARTGGSLDPLEEERRRREQLLNLGGLFS